MPDPDILVLGAGVASFGFFLLVHVIFFRFLKPKVLINAIYINFCLGLPAAIWSAWTVADYSGAEKAICFILVLIIYGAAAFAYVLCIFGPYETSIRMRLIRELGGSTGQTPLPDVLRRYNTAIILENRLTRLVGSQDLAKKGDTYHLRKTGNVFFIMDTVAQKMHAFIHAR